MDLLHKRTKVTIREDGEGKVQKIGLKELRVSNADELLAAIKKGNAGKERPTVVHAHSHTHTQ